MTDRLYPLVQLARAGKITNPQVCNYKLDLTRLVGNALVGGVICLVKVLLYVI